MTTTQTQVRSTEEALKLALEAMRGLYGGWRCEAAIKACEEALAGAECDQQPEQEPAWYHAECDDPDHSGFFKEAIDAVTQVNEHGGFVTQLYTTSPQRTAAEGEDTRRAWVGLTQDQINNLSEMSETVAAVIATDLILKQKNGFVEEKNT